MSKISFNSTFEYKLIYIFRINDNAHKGLLKIGDATIHTNKKYSEIVPNSHDLNYAARERINSYTVTANIQYELLYTEIAVFTYTDRTSKKYGKVLAFRDHNVHSVLKRSGIKPRKHKDNNTNSEWYPCDLNTAIEAIKAVKENKTSLKASSITSGQNPIIFRPEQQDAIKKTIDRYKDDTQMLWNAKMRFGKTLSALEVAKRMEFKKTIIVTHRPVVDEGWFDDFKKIFYDRPEYKYGSKNNGSTFKDLNTNHSHFVYFASMQDLRGSEKVGGNFDKNLDVFKTEWDFVVVDEAHEGTQTKLGKAVLNALVKQSDTHKTYTLELSGTPFNLLTDFEEASIYTWDYIMEQEAKNNWYKNHFGDSNPYEELPKMNIFTYHLEKSLPVYLDVEDKAFNFREFFRLWTGDKKLDLKDVPSNAKVGDFVHENDVKTFLDLICKKDNNTNYPFATEAYRGYFRHSLWVVPGVKEAKALSKLLKEHHVFKHFTIVNVAGEGDEEIDTSDALRAVKNAMTDKPDETYTITISCGRLTTGVSVPEWTAVLMLAGTYSTAASQYLQTIFRVQTPANINGRIKEDCYVFDFAPDRTLKIVTESVQLSAKAGAKNISAEITLGKFLNYCPIISISESNMKEFSVNYLLQELKKAYAERVAKNGFDDPKMYNDELLKLTEVELKEFEKLKAIVGNSKQQKKTGEIDVNDEGFDEEELEKIKKIQDKPKKERTPEEIAKLKELAEKRKNRQSAISILRAISIRMPLLVYGMDININEEVTIDKFPDLVDDVSWEEFMPKGVTKEIFKQFSKYYDKDIFIAASNRIRVKALTSDDLEPLKRVKKIAELFSTFKNPDKETVLTPWRVVNMHMSDTLGGWDFFDENHNMTLEKPRFVDQGEVTKEVFNKTSSILEINSKTGLYPLYVTYSLFREHCKDYKEEDLTYEKQYEIWDSVVKKQVFVVCKSPMAKSITRRTLLGYRNGKINAHAFDDLIMQFKSKMNDVVTRINRKSFWNIGGIGDMKFNAVVGNPPYQENVANRSEQPPVYHYFWEASILLSNISTLITPARFLFNVGKTPKEWNDKMLNSTHFKVVSCYMNSQDVFPNVDIKGGVAVCLNNKNESYEAIKKYFANDILEKIFIKVSKQMTNSIAEIMCSNTSYKYHSSFFDENPGFSTRVSGGSKRYLSSSVFSKFPEVFLDSKPSLDYCEIIGLINNKRFVKYFKTSYLIPPKNFKSYKVLIPASNGSGALGEKISTPMMGHPMMGHTESFISIGDFKTEQEASNLLKYVKTKFSRLMLGVNKVTQGNKTKETWMAVPLENFSDLSDINWNEEVNEIDKQLYKKYNLSDDEIKFIESNVQEMK